MTTLNFDARQVEPATAPEPIPTGWYNAKIIESEMKPTKDNDGSAYLALTLQILDGQYVNRKVFDRLNLMNKNPVAQEIAYKTLSAICHATGVIQVQDSQQLHNIPLMVRVVLRPATVNQTNGQAYDASNEVKGYKRMEMAGQPTSGFGVPSQPPAGPAAWTPPAHAPQAPAAPQGWAPAAPPAAPPQAQAAPPLAQGNWAPPQQQAPAQAAPWQAPAQAAPPQAAPSQSQPWQPPAQSAPQPPAQPQQPPQAQPGPVPPWAQPAR